MRAHPLCWMVLLVLAPPAARGEDFDRIDRMVAAGVVAVKAGPEGGAPAGYGLVCSSGALVGVPAALLGEQKKPLILSGGQSYTPTEVQTDPRGTALCRVPIDGVNTVPLGSPDTVTVGATVRVLRPAEQGFRRLEGKVVSNDTRRIGRIRFRVLELDVASQGLALGLPVYLPDSGQVIGMLGVQGEIVAGVGVQASAVDALAGLILNSGLQLKPNLLTEAAAVVDPAGRLLERYVTRWQFEAGNGTIGAELRRSLQYWQSSYGRFPDQLTQPLIDHGYAFFGDWYGHVYALELAQQRRSWISSGIGFRVVHPPVIGVEAICATGGVLWPASRADYDNILVQQAMFRQQDALGGRIKQISEHWRERYGGSFWSHADPWLLFALYGAGTLTGLDRATGRERWSLAVSYPSRPLAFSERVYFAGLGLRGCAAMADGRLLWAFGDTYGADDREHNTWWHTAHVDQDRLLYLAVPLRYVDDQKRPRLVGEGRCHVVQCDPFTGEKKKEWDLGKLGFDKHGTERPLVTHTVLDSPGTPAEALYGLVGQVLFRLVPATGEYTTLCSLAGGKDDIAFSTELAVKDNVVYVGTSKRELLALDATTGRAVWAQTPVLKSLVGSPLVLGGVVYAGTADGYLHAFSAASGQELWWYELGGKVVGQPVPLQEGDKDLLYCALDNGNFVSVELPAL